MKTEIVDPKRILWMEMGAIAALYFLPSIWAGISALLHTRASSSTMPAGLTNLTWIVFYLRRLLPALFIVWTTGEGLGTFGFRRFSVLRGSAAIALVLATYIAFSWMAATLWPAAGSIPLTRELSFYFTAMLANFVSLVVEEFLVRAYLLKRLEELTGRAWIAILVSVLVYVALHLGSGLRSVPINAVIGMVLVLSYRISGSIWPGVIGRLLGRMVPTLLGIN